MSDRPAPVEGLGVLGQIAAGERFAFGANWTRFLRLLTPERVAEAERSLREMLRVDNLNDRTFLDVGSGSGLFSLAARRLGTRVLSFDYDPESVACTKELRHRFFSEDPLWHIQQGSALDAGYVAGLGRFDIVYSWGVLHHTGALWIALSNVAGAVAPGGIMAIAVYNRQRILTPMWTELKRLYQALPEQLHFVLVWPYVVYSAGASAAADLLHARAPWSRWHGHRRGMSLYHDAVDWVGGWPFEAASREEVLEFAGAHRLELLALNSAGRRHGCNEFLFIRVGPVPPRAAGNGSDAA